MITIGLHKHNGLAECAIKWQTRSPYSHASVIMDAGQYAVEAVWPRVRLVERPPIDPQADYFKVSLTPEQETRVREFLLKQVGKPYDLTMVCRFVTRQQETRKSQGKWFCSELIFAAFKTAGVELLARIEPWEVSPGTLSNSPLLVLI